MREHPTVFADFARLEERSGLGLSIPLGREDRTPRLAALTDGEPIMMVEPDNLMAEGAAQSLWIAMASPRRYREQTWVDPRQAFRISLTDGIGSFADAPIRYGEVVEIVGGVVMSDEEFQTFQRANPRFNAIQIDEHLHLVEAPEVTAQRQGGSLNHSCDANLWMVDEVTLVARRDIATDEELTVDYALFTAQPDWRLDHPCACGAPACRHIITGDDWRREDVRKRYYPHFSPFLNRRIENGE